MGSDAPYVFGHDGAAARRLAMVAEMYEPTSRAFLEAALRRGVGRALDLGCGPGHTTALLAESAAAELTSGLDSSESFVAAARRKHARPGIEFTVHDVSAPLPTEADVIYSRLLLAHLRDPGAALRHWLRALRPGGTVLLEEVEAVDASEPAFREYLTAVTSLMQHKGTRLDIGGELTGMATRAGATVRMDRVVEVTPTTGHVARMFAMNLPSWRGEAISHGVWDDTSADAVAEELAALAVDEGTGRIAWQMRQVAASALR